MNTDDLARLRPAERDLPADRKRILKEHLMTELRRADETRARPPHARPRHPGRHLRRHRVVLATGAVLTAAAVTAAVAVGTWATHAKPGGHPTARTTQTAPATAAQLLAKIAAAAARQPSPAVGDSDFTYIRSMVASTVDSISNGHETS